MTDQSAQLADAASDIDEAANAGLVPQLSMMIGALFASPVRNTLLILGSGLVVVILLTALGRSGSTAGTSPSTTHWRATTSMISWSSSASSP